MSESDQRLALAVPPWRPARSLATAEPGEVILVDADGRLQTWRTRAVRLVRLGVVGGAFGVLAGAVATMLGPVFGALALVGMAGGMVGWAFRAQRLGRVLRPAMTLHMEGRFREARETIEPLVQRKDCAPGVLRIAAASSWALGRHEEALALLQRAAPHATGLEHWLNQSMRVLVLATMGRVDEAKRAREALGSGPGGEVAELAQPLLPLTLAFHADDAALVPDEETQHAWSRAALLRNHFGGVLYYLSWAAWKRGDDELAQHLLREAVPRTRTVEEDLSAPKLAAWRAARLAEWGDDGDRL
jgi:hypothetical protein